MQCQRENDTKIKRMPSFHSFTLHTPSCCTHNTRGPVKYFISPEQFPQGVSCYLLGQQFSKTIKAHYKMKLLVVVVSVLLLIISLLQLEVSAYKQGPFKSMISGRRISALNQVSYSATESLKRQMSLYRKQPIAVVVERRRIPPIPVQSVRELESTVKISGRYFL
jgi:hypothetical protein